MVQNKDIERMIADVNASMALEGFKPSKENDQIFREFINGEITEAEALKRIKSLLDK